MERGMRTRKILSPEMEAEIEAKMLRKADSAGEGGESQKKVITGRKTRSSRHRAKAGNRRPCPCRPGRNRSNDATAG